MPRLIFMFLLFTVITFFLGRFMGRFWYRRPAARSEQTDSADELVQDPNCLTYLSRKTALTVRSGGSTRYFCGSECAAAFEKKQAKKESSG